VDITRVSATQETLRLIQELESEYGPLVFHQSGGCCDGSAPMCFPRNEFRVGAQDPFLGEIGGSPFFMSNGQFSYWEHTHLIIDVVDGRGGMFSIEGPSGKRFLTRSRLFSDNEWAVLKNTPVKIASEINFLDGLRTTAD